MILTPCWPYLVRTERRALSATIVIKPTFPHDIKRIAHMHPHLTILIK